MSRPLKSNPWRPSHLLTVELSRQVGTRDEVNFEFFDTDSTGKQYREKEGQINSMVELTDDFSFHENKRRTYQTKCSVVISKFPSFQKMETY